MKSISFLTLIVPCFVFATWFEFDRTPVMKPSDTQAYRLSYKFDGYQLRSGQTIELEIPENFKTGILDFVYVTHKQDPRDENECRSRREGSVIWDCMPGYTSFEVLSSHADRPDDNQDWRFWGGAGSGPFNSKFAEIREGWGETDNLYEWTHYGHLSVATKEKSHDPLIPARFRVRSVGPDSVILQEIVVKFAPPAPKREEEIIFANGFVFGSFDTAIGRRYPGRASLGDYGNALSLDPRWLPRHPSLRLDWSVGRGELRIPISSDDILSFIDVACGDMKQVPSGGDPEYYRGGSHLNIFVVRADGTQETLMWKENIGTTGVMRVTLNPDSLPVRQGDLIIVKASEDVARIMGIRFGFK